jgi:hypothetical protein
MANLMPAISMQKEKPEGNKIFCKLQNGLFTGFKPVSYMF